MQPEDERGRIVCNPRIGVSGLHAIYRSPVRIACNPWKACLDCIHTGQDCMQSAEGAANLHPIRRKRGRIVCNPWKACPDCTPPLDAGPDCMQSLGGVSGSHAIRRMTGPDCRQSVEGVSGLHPIRGKWVPILGNPWNLRPIIGNTKGRSLACIQTLTAGNISRPLQKNDARMLLPA